MSYETKYKAGSWNVICDICGFQIKSHDARMTWDGLLVCPDDYDPKHAHLDPPPAINDPTPITSVQPEGSDTTNTLTTTERKDLL